MTLDIRDRVCYKQNYEKQDSLKHSVHSVLWNDEFLNNKENTQLFVQSLIRFGAKVLIIRKEEKVSFSWNEKNVNG